MTFATIHIDNSSMETNSPSLSYEERKRQFYDDPSLYSREVAICIVANNRLDKTKLCVESVLRYTTRPFQLVLVDNGSQDATLDYFQSIAHDDTIVIRLEKNVGCNYAMRHATKIADARFLCFLGNDCIVTQGWLDNLIACMESDRRIGMVAPASCNVSNGQGVDIGYFRTWNEMQALAAVFNRKDPAKWEDRCRLVTVCALVRCEALDYVGAFFDLGFYHDSSDDDLSLRLRSWGYRLVLCKDTFVMHNHFEQERNMQRWIESCASGERAMAEKYGKMPLIS